MARIWFAGFDSGPKIPPPKVNVCTKGDPAQSNSGVFLNNTCEVKDFATAHKTVPTKAVHVDAKSDGSVTSPVSAPQKELDTEPTEEVVDGSVKIAKFIQQYSKPKELPAVAKSKEPATSKRAGMMDTFNASSSAPRRAPTAQMVPLLPNAAVTSALAATATRETSTALSLPILLSSTAVPSKKCVPKTSTPRTPQITLTPAPPTAPSAFKDGALAARVQNTRLLTPVKQQANGIKKRPYVKKSSPLKSALTPESIPGGDKRERGHGRGRPRTWAEEQPLQHSRQPWSEEQSLPKSIQDRPPIQLNTPLPRAGFPNLSNHLSLSATSAFPTQQNQAVTLNISSKLTFCSEEPRLWPEGSDHVASLLRFNSKPETIHSAPIKRCANHAAHQDPQSPLGYGVCTTCRHNARRHIRATRPKLVGSAWWPLCKTCGDNAMLHIEPSRQGCSCCTKWHCFECQMEEVDRRDMKNGVEGEFRRRTFSGEGMDGNVKTVFFSWACECGGEIRPDATLLKCIGCDGLRYGRQDPQETAVREMVLTKTALAWT